MAKGKVYLIGAGPGEAQLVTLKAISIIPTADVIMFDHLVPIELLNLAPVGAEIISVAKFSGKHTVPQPDICKLIVKKAKQGKTVIRLKGGDPYLFGRGGEEALACAQADIDFEVIPGITSPLAASCYAGIPATHRDYTASVALVTGHRKDKSPIDIPKAGTIIFLMPVANMQKIIDSLLNAGYSKNTKIAAVQNATCYNQKVIVATLSSFVRKAKEANLQPPAIFIVGKVVELSKELDWFSKKPKILVLGNHPEKYTHLGTIVHRPIIDCLPQKDYSKIDPVLKQLHNFDWLTFTSPFGVKFFFERLNHIGKDSRFLCNIKVAAIGKTTAQKLTDFGINADIVPKTESSTGLLKEFKKLKLDGKKILLPCSNLATNELPDGLKKFGAKIKKLKIYKTAEIDPGPIDFDYIDKILFTSGSTVRAFVKRFGKPALHIKILCLGVPSQNEAKKFNIKARVIK